MINISFGTYPVKGAMEARQALTALGSPIPAELARANSLSLCCGQEASRGYLLMQRYYLDNAVFLDALSDLTFTLYDPLTNTTQTLTWKSLVICREPLNLTPNLATDANSLYLIEVADARWRVHNPYYFAAATAMYNVSANVSSDAEGPTVYLEESLSGDTITDATNATPIVITSTSAHNLTTGDRVTVSDVGGNELANGVWLVTVTGDTTFSLDDSDGADDYTSGGTWTTRWTWDFMLADLWGMVADQLGSYPGLPVTPAGFPLGWIFEGVSAWGAICQILARIGCTVRPDPTQDAGSQFTIVQIGAADAASDAILAAIVGAKVHDAEYLAVYRGRIPANVLVHFRKQINNQPGLSSDLPYTVSVAGTTATAESVTHPIWDDMRAFYDTGGALVNGAALATRAAERAADYYRGLLAGGDRFWKRYSGLVAITPGSTIRTVTFSSVGEGDLYTDVVRHPTFAEDTAEDFVRVGSTGDCHAILDQCTGAIFYMRSVNGIPTYSDEPCPDCLGGSGGDPPGGGTVPTACCDDPLPSTMCASIGPLLPAGLGLYYFCGNIVVPLNTMVQNAQGTTWSGHFDIVSDQIFGVPVASVSVECLNFSPELKIASVKWVINDITTYFLKFDDEQSAVCDPFSINRYGHVWQTFGNSAAPADTGATVLVTVTAGPCTTCVDPTVTLSTTNLIGNAASFTIAGTGFSTTPAQNVVTLNLAATCHVTVATTTLLTCVFDAHPNATGSLTAVVSVNGCTSGAAVQVKTIIAPLSGIQIIGLTYNKFLNSTFTTPAVTMQGGLAVVNMSIGLSAAAQPTIYYNGVAMTVADGITYNDEITIYQYYLAVGAGSGQFIFVPEFPCLMSFECFNIKGLASNALDKKATASGAGGATGGRVINLEGGTPHEVTTDAPHGLTTGATVTIAGIVNHPSDNATWTITVTAANRFTLDTTVGAPGSYAEDGTWAQGAGSASPDTGATAATTVADEAVIAGFALMCPTPGTWTWGGSFVAGGQTVVDAGGGNTYILTEGRRILSATGTVDASLTLSGFVGTKWAGIVCTYK